MNRSLAFGVLSVPLALLWAVAAGSQIPSAQEKPAPAETSSVPTPGTVPNPLPQGTRIFLKDGNYLLAREYKIQGDRVRLWSVERSDWEEIPTEIVDWDATHKGEAEDAARTKQIDEKLKAIEVHARAASLDVDTSIEVAPNVYLPDEAGFYVVSNGTVTSLSQDLAQSTRSKTRLLAQILVPIPVIASKHNVDLKGAHAKLRVRDPQPEFYFRTADHREPDVTLVKAEVHGNSRHLTEVDTLAVTGETHTNEKQVLLERWVAARGTYRYTLPKKLDPGEYAFVENVPSQGVELFVWDFGVDTPPKP